MAFGWKWSAWAGLLLVGTMAASAAAQERQKQVATSHKPVASGTYYVEFRAADIGVYGHSYIMFGRLGPGGRPATVRYADFHPEGGTLGLAVGHAVPVAAEMTPDPETLRLPITASFRRTITAAQYASMVDAINRVHANNRVWSALAYNCNAFVGDVASSIGMKTPTSLLFATAFIPALRSLNEPDDGSAAASPGSHRAAPERDLFSLSRIPALPHVPVLRFSSENDTATPAPRRPRRAVAAHSRRPAPPNPSRTEPPPPATSTHRSAN